MRVCDGCRKFGRSWTGVYVIKSKTGYCGSLDTESDLMESSPVPFLGRQHSSVHDWSTNNERYLLECLEYWKWILAVRAGSCDKIIPIDWTLTQGKKAFKNRFSMAMVIRNAKEPN